MNQLPQATALHIPESAFMPKVDRATLKKKLWAPRREALERVEEEVASAVTEEPATTSQSAHLTPKQFVRMKCSQYGYDFEAVTTPGPRSRKIVAQRDRLMREVDEAYPKRSRAALGALFGGMKPSSVFNSLQRSGAPTAKRIFNSIPKDRVMALHRAGEPQWKIAEIVGCSESAVSLIIRGKMGNKPPPRLMDDYEGQIKSMFDAGLKLVEIADRLSFTSGAVSKFIRKHRWSR